MLYIDQKSPSLLPETVIRNIRAEPCLGKLLHTRVKFFVIKSYSEDDLHRAIKYGVWCSTKVGNSKLDNAYRDLIKVHPNQEPGRLFLFFSPRLFYPPVFRAPRPFSSLWLVPRTECI